LLFVERNEKVNQQGAENNKGRLKALEAKTAQKNLILTGMIAAHLQ
jgi:hypothetical protein